MIFAEATGFNFLGKGKDSGSEEESFFFSIFLKVLGSKELSPKYNPAEVEAGRYQKWLDEDVFKPSGDKKAKPYSIVIPPPNVTGKLHLGHAWDTTLQDIIIRQKRMQGFDTLWLPGMDHAGIATQAKVEARLAESGISRYDLGREKFLDKVWEWKDEYASTIKQQWGKMGLSVDYSRERFTLDEGLSKAVRKVFVDLYNDGFSVNTVTSIKGLLTKSFNFAVDRNYIPASPAVNLVIPKNKQPDRPTRFKQHIFLEKDQVDKIFERFPKGTSSFIPLKIAYHTGMRPGEVFGLIWDDIDFDNKVLTIPRKLMKVKDKNFDDFKMPLSEELINIFKEQKDLTGYQTWVFLGTNHRTSINVESPNKALKIMGFDDEENGKKITLHGFRGTFRSMIETLDVNNQFSFEIKERALDHQESSKVVRAYAHKADYIKQLSLLMDYWSDFIISLKTKN